MKVTTDSERALKSQTMVLELLQADMPEADYTRHNEVDLWSAKLGLGKPRFAARSQPARDVSHPAIAVNLDACIQVHASPARLPRRAGQRRHRPGLQGRARLKIVFDMDDPMGASTCVACGEWCVQACLPAR